MDPPPKRKIPIRSHLHYQWSRRDSGRNTRRTRDPSVTVSHQLQKCMWVNFLFWSNFWCIIFILSIQIILEWCLWSSQFWVKFKRYTNNNILRFFFFSRWVLASRKYLTGVHYISIVQPAGLTQKRKVANFGWYLQNSALSVAQIMLFPNKPRVSL